MKIAYDTPITAKPAKELLNRENIVLFVSNRGESRHDSYWFRQYLFACHLMHEVEARKIAMPSSIYSVDTPFSRWARAYEQGKRDFQCHDFSFSEGFCISIMMAFDQTGRYGWGEAETSRLNIAYQAIEREVDVVLSVQDLDLLVAHALRFLAKGSIELEASTCQMTGYSIRVNLLDWKFAYRLGHYNDDMVYYNPERKWFDSVSNLKPLEIVNRLMSVEFPIPSGKLLMTDRFREIPNWRKIIYNETFSLESAVDRQDLTMKMLDKWGMLRIFTTRSPNFHEKDGRLFAYSGEEALIPDLGQIYTDVWSVECFDEDRFKGLLVEFFGFSLEDAALKVEKMVQDESVIRVEMPAGSYHAYFSDDDKIFHEKFKSEEIPNDLFEELIFVLSPQKMVFDPKK